MDDDLGFYIREPLAPGTTVQVRRLQFKTPTTLAPQPKWMLVFFLVLGSFGVLRHGYPWDPAPRWVDPSWPVGIRGWLIPVAILTALSAVSWPFTLWMSAGNLDVATWGHLSAITQTVLLGFTALGVVIEAALVLTVVLFFTRRSSTPALVIATNCAASAWVLLLQLYEAFNHLLGKLTVADVLRTNWPGWLGVAVFVAYFSLSKRVRATFVNRHQPRGTLDRATMEA